MLVFLGKEEGNARTVKNYGGSNTTESSAVRFLVRKGPEKIGGLDKKHEKAKMSSLHSARKNASLEKGALLRRLAKALAIHRIEKPQNPEKLEKHWKNWFWQILFLPIFGLFFPFLGLYFSYFLDLGVFYSVDGHQIQKIGETLQEIGFGKSSCFA